MELWHRAKIWILLLLAAVMLVGCSQPSSSEEQQEPPTVRGEMAKLSPKEGNWLALTQAQMQEDAAYLSQVLQENFPYYGIVERKTGVDLQAEFAVCQAEIAECETDVQFYLALDRWLNKAEGLGHLMLFQPGMYAPTAQLYQDALGETDIEDDMDRQRLADVYNNELSHNSYTDMMTIIAPCFDKVNAYYAEVDDNTEDTQADAWQNIETKIIEEGSIAYIAINSLDSTSYEEDRETLFAFYNQVKDYDHVIFDFTQNGGGSMDYFNNLVAAPNTDRTLQAQVYSLIMAGNYNLTFFDLDDWQPAASLPDLPRMNQEDLAMLDFYDATPYTVEPAGEHKLLNGKLWMLVGPNVFSSSEYAAMLCKTTGFMTLVGTTTGGDGIGFDPVPVVLPNSGFVVRYSAIYGTTADGASSQECGTEPDLISPEGEEPLETCLKAISQEMTA